MTFFLQGTELLERIASLERRLSALEQQRSSIIRASQLVLRPGDGAPAAVVIEDADGRPRASLSTDGGGSVELALSDCAGRRRIAIQLNEGGEPSVYLWGQVPVHLIALRAGNGVEPEVVVHAGVERRGRLTATDEHAATALVPEAALAAAPPDVRAAPPPKPAALADPADEELTTVETELAGLMKSLRSLRREIAGGEQLTTPSIAPARPVSTTRLPTQFVTAEPLVRGWIERTKAPEATLERRRGIVVQRGDIRLELCAVLHGRLGERRWDRGVRVVVSASNGGSYPIEGFEFGTDTRAWDAEGEEHGMLGTPICLDAYGEVATGTPSSVWRPHLSRHFLLWFPTLDSTSSRLRKVTVNESYRSGGQLMRHSWVLVLPNGVA